MSHFADRLNDAVKQKGNAVCLGLDPRFDLLPAPLREDAIKRHGHTPAAVAEAFIAFNTALLDALADLVPVCKPQVAFYEEFGSEGIRAFEATVRHAKAKGYVVISDAKRGDIGSTAVAYARAHLGGMNITGGATVGFDADALTVNPYLGHDTLRPYLDIGVANGKGFFVLVKTSNPGSGDLQDLESGGKKIYEHVAEMVNALGEKHVGRTGFHPVGAVVGATYPEQLRELREKMPRAILLIPGYGAQGGTAADAAAGFHRDGLGAVVNSSRGIVFACKEQPYAKDFGEARFAEAARAAAEKMASDLNAALKARR
ncbi:MAG: orotidine-5'-phosphate decarboxylase [Planctomycetota bacterium]|nr:orotidine-5'-phosphate decarboxylase [Planctomycetota bacterium]